jgi:RNA polymerase sigma-70 factor, ECF subfamily
MTLRALYDDHADALFAFLLQLTQSEADARDLLQEIFCQLAVSPIPGSVTNVRSWLFRCAYRRFVDDRRHRSVRLRHAEVPPDPVFQPPAEPDAAAFQAAVTDGLRELPEDQQVVVHLKLWQQQTFEDIASTLNISPNTAASRYRYGIEKLRTLLRPLYEEIR